MSNIIESESFTGWWTQTFDTSPSHDGGEPPSLDEMKGQVFDKAESSAKEDAENWIASQPVKPSSLKLSKIEDTAVSFTELSRHEGEIGASHQCWTAVVTVMATVTWVPIPKAIPLKPMLEALKVDLLQAA